MKKIVYIGNNLPNKNPTTLNLLSHIFSSIGFQVEVYSNKLNKIARLLDMCIGVLKNGNSNYIVIDTYSTINFYFALIVSQIARILGVPYIPVLHGGNLPIRLKSNPRLSNLIFKHSFVNVAPSNYLKIGFERNEYNTIFIPNAIQLKEYNFLERHILQPRLLWVRAFDAIYNPEMAIEVLAKLKKKYPNASLCMVGPDKDGSMEQCIKLAKELNVLEAIEFTGLLPKKAWIDKSTVFDIFINTTNIDNTPVSVLEVMALGLTVVSTNVGGLPYLIDEGIDGILVAKNDVDAMAHEICKLVETNDQKMVSCARKKVERFDVESVKDDWNNLLSNS